MQFVAKSGQLQVALKRTFCFLAENIEFLNSFFVFRFYYAQSLYQAGIFGDALKVLKQISDNEELKEQCLQLQSAILYSSEDFAGAQSVLNQRTGGKAETLNDEGCLLYQADQFETAVQRFNSALQVGGFNPLIAYNLALSHFRKKEKTQALDYTSKVKKYLVKRCGTYKI